jgi:LacI family transcriptional regulator
MGRRATIRDVAAMAGASIKTVSRVVNDEPGVSAELSARVKAAIDHLGYQHNLSASNLRRGNQRTDSIGLVLQDVSNPFEGALHHSIEQVARRHGIAVLAASVEGDGDRERQVLAELIRRRVDGVIVMPTPNDVGFLDEERDLGMQLVFVDRPANGIDADTVVADNRNGAALGVRHLVAAGHRRIAFLGDDRRLVTASQRHLGYLDALAEAGIDADAALQIDRVGDPSDAARATSRLFELTDPPTAIFAARNLTTQGVLTALRTLGLGRRVALVGFDDFPLADLLEPGVTVVAQDPRAIGARAAELLLERIARHDRRRARDAGRSTDAALGTEPDEVDPPSVHEVIAVTLLERGSGEIRPS